MEYTVARSTAPAAFQGGSPEGAGPGTGPASPNTGRRRRNFLDLSRGAKTRVPQATCPFGDRSRPTRLPRISVTSPRWPDCPVSPDPAGPTVTGRFEVEQSLVRPHPHTPTVLPLCEGAPDRRHEMASKGAPGGFEQPVAYQHRLGPPHPQAPIARSTKGRRPISCVGVAHMGACHPDIRTAVVHKDRHVVQQTEKD